jgi:diguanylate cyclase (GGDEF)-like protein
MAFQTTNMDLASFDHTERVFSQLGRDLSATTSAGAAADIILSAADALIGWEASYLILYDPQQGGRPRPLLTIDTINEKRVKMPDAVPEAPSGNMLKAIEDDGFMSLYEQPITLDPSMSFGDPKRRTLSQLFVPVKSGRRTIGVLSVQSYHLNAYSQKSLETLKALANHCAGALERVWAQEALAQMVERLKALYQAAHAVSASLDMDQLCDAIHSAVEAVMPCNDFVIDGYDPATNEIIPLYAIEHPRQRVSTQKYYADHGLAGQIVHSGRSLLFNSVEEMDRSGINFELYGSSATDPTQSVVAVPMILHGKVAGMISTQAYQANAYTRDDQSLLELLASHAAIAMENARLFATVQRLADTDPLTDLFTRRKFYEHGEREFLRASQGRTPLVVMMLDIDNFKKLNDQFGHKVGDAILQVIADQLIVNVREGDILCRHGGEEFAILLPHTAPTEALPFAERLRGAVEHTDLKAAQDFLEAATGSRSANDGMRVTISIGLAEYSRSCPNFDMLIDRADRAMYMAKQDGRNRVKLWAE